MEGYLIQIWMALIIIILSNSSLIKETQGLNLREENLLSKEKNYYQANKG